MPRYLVERSFDASLQLGVGPEGAETCRAICEQNLRAEVTWLHSYVRADGRKTFCLYEAPSPEAVRRAATLNRLPIDEITEIRVLDPSFYRGA